MGTKPAMNSEIDETVTEQSMVYYDHKAYMVETKVSGSFSLNIREIERNIVRNPYGRETLTRQRIIGEKKLVYEIPPFFFEEQETCQRFVENVLSKAGVDSLIQECAVPNISRDANTMNSLSREEEEEEEEEKGFIVEAEAEHVKETVCGPKYRERPIEKECIICLEELSLSSAEEEEKKTIMKLRCGHSFHKGCILSWLRSKHSCPTCRGDINNS